MTEENIHIIRRLVEDGHHLTVSEIAPGVGISYDGVLGY